MKRKSASHPFKSSSDDSEAEMRETISQLAKGKGKGKGRGKGDTAKVNDLLLR